MASATVITITHDQETNLDLQKVLKLPTTDPKREVQEIVNFLNQLNSGTRKAVLDLQIDGGDSVAASGTITCATVIATNTVIVAGVTLTAVTGAAGANQFDRSGGTDTITATNLKVAINANATLAAGLIATSSGAVVTITSLIKGTIGNLISLTSSGGTLAVVAPAGGTNATANAYNCGY